MQLFPFISLRSVQLPPNTAHSSMQKRERRMLDDAALGYFMFLHSLLNREKKKNNYL
jgi:hypothetical protein